MKAISKTQIIDLMININRDGVDNTQYSIDILCLLSSLRNGMTA